MKHNPHYTDLDILKAFLKVSETKSRAQLAQSLGIGEGSIRSILERLKELGLIDSSSKGHIYTNKGTRNLVKLNDLVKFLDDPKLDFSSGMSSVALRVGHVGKIKSDAKIRDSAVREGAEGAMILQYCGNPLKLRFPSFAFDDKNIEKLSVLTHYEKDDALIVVWAKTESLAMNGAIRIVQKICPSFETLTFSIIN